MGGVIIIINEVQWLCHLHQYVHEVQHLHLHFLVLTMEQHELHYRFSIIKIVLFKSISI